MRMLKSVDPSISIEIVYHTFNIFDMNRDKQVSFENFSTIINNCDA